MKKMKWQKDLETYFPIYQTLLLEGFIDDDQLYDNGNGEEEFVNLAKYLEKKYNDNEDLALSKRVIIYDLTEAPERRFKICDDYVLNQDENGQDRPVYDTNISNNFNRIITDEAIDDLLITHRSSGVTLDLARIHFAISEGSSRMPEDKLPEVHKQSFQSIFDNPNVSGYLFVIKMATRMITNSNQRDSMSDEELMIFRQLLNISLTLDEIQDEEFEHKLDNKVIILCDKVQTLPSWFVDEANNPVKRINVNRPSDENKVEFFNEMVDDNVFTEEFTTRYNAIRSENQAENGVNRNKNKIEKMFLGYTTDFSLKMLRKYREYVSAHPLTNPEKIGFSLSSFLVGDMENPWDSPEIIDQMINIKQAVTKKIQGQDFAMDTAQNIIARAALGLDREENPSAPRVVLFLAGPTGTGKTELCKQLAQAVFGSENRIIRFDMSEYQQDESDQKLFGAPPGYVGYEEGGKLTNAIKKEPFSLVLFDEIEKAAPSILDKFLQILGDGRLTDGHGETVRFTDSIIVITSNAGVTRYTGLPGESPEHLQARMNELMGNDMVTIRPELLAKAGGEIAPMNIKEVQRLEEQEFTPEEIYEVVKENLRYNVKSYFFCKLGRPELYGRIEDSLVYYNYICKGSVGPISRSKIKDVVKVTEEKYGVKIVCDQSVYDAIEKDCQRGEVRAIGARGIIKNTGKIFTTSLTNYLKGHLIAQTLDQLRGKTLSCAMGPSYNPDEPMKNEDIVWTEN